MHNLCADRDGPVTAATLASVLGTPLLGITFSDWMFHSSLVIETFALLAEWGIGWSVAPVGAADRL